MYKKYEQFICLSGMPRSGSTLLSAILSQNPLIHSEGNSALCQIMWDSEQSMLYNCSEQIKANNRQQTVNDIMETIPHIYYKNIDENEKIIIDKCRSWTISSNYELLKKYIDKDIKIIILERPLIEVVNSYVKLYNSNNIIAEIDTLLDINSEPIMRSYAGIINCKKQLNENFLFITYEELVTKTDETINKIYNFCGWKYFKHNYNNIIQKYPENDNIYRFKNLHLVHSSINPPDKNLILPIEIIEKCLTIEKLFNENKI